MKVIFEREELIAVKEMAENIESGSWGEIMKCIDKNPLTERRIASDNSGDTMFVFDADYMVEALRESAKTAGILWPCLKAAYNALSSYFKNVADLAQIHARRMSAKNRERRIRMTTHVCNTSDEVSVDHVIKILATNGVTKVTDLPVEVQNVLRNAYSVEVIKKAEDGLGFKKA